MFSVLWNVDPTLTVVDVFLVCEGFACFKCFFENVNQNESKLKKSSSIMVNFMHCVVYNNNTRLTALCLGLPWWAGTRKVKPVWILLKQERNNGWSSISCRAICKCAPHPRQIPATAPHHLIFYRPDAVTAFQPTASKHWRHDALHQIFNVHCIVY